MFEEETKYKGFELYGNETTQVDQDGVQYTVLAQDRKSNEEFQYTAKVTNTVIASEHTQGFDGDRETALKKMKEIAFDNITLKINNNDYTDKTYIYSVVDD